MIASLPVVAGRATIRVSITIRPKAGSFKRETVQCDKTNRLAPEAGRNGNGPPLSGCLSDRKGTRASGTSTNPS
jgi:hypothetical protein